MQNLEETYTEKSDTYFNGTRRDFVSLLPDNPQAAVLEIGCGFGGTGALALATKKCATWIGVDISTDAVIVASSVLTQALAGNIETMDLPFAEGSFDVLVISEVLEHLFDPWNTLHRLARLVKPGGLVMASSPCVAHHRVIRNLLAGRWDLAESGVMDRTHLRWFTPVTYSALFEGAGFSVQSVEPVTPFRFKARLFNRLTGNRLRHLVMTQIAIIGVKRARS